MKSINKKYSVGDIVMFLILFAVALLFIFPILWMLAASFQGQGQIFKMPFNFLPLDGNLDNYRYAWEKGGMGSAFINSLKATALLMIIQVFLSTFVGYVFCKYDFKLKKLCLMLIMMTLMVPGELTYFPVFEIVKNLHLANTSFGLVFPFLFSGFGIIFMRQFADYIPNEILEAARIDGCGHLRTFFLVALPMMKSAISGIAILAFTFIWSEFAWARAIVTKDSAKTLALALTHLAMGYDNFVNYAALTAGGILVMAPILVVFLLFQKNFIESVAGSGVKG